MLDIMPPNTEIPVPSQELPPCVVFCELEDELLIILLQDMLLITIWATHTANGPTRQQRCTHLIECS